MILGGVRERNGYDYDQKILHEYMKVSKTIILSNKKEFNDGLEGWWIRVKRAC